MPRLSSSASNAADYFERFIELYRGGSAPALRGSETAVYSPKRESVLTSQWNDTIEFIAASCRLGCPAAEVPIVAYVPHIDAWARRAAKAKGDSLAAQNNAVSSLRFIVNAVSTLTAGATHLRGADAQRSSIPEAWHAGFNAVVALNVPLGNFVAHAARIAALHGVAAPADAPTDVATWEGWAVEAGLSNGTADSWVRAVNRARILLGPEAGWPAIRRTDLRAFRSAKHIPKLAEKLIAAGEKRPLRLLNQRDIINALFPFLGQALDGLLIHRVGRTRRNGDKRCIQAAGRLAFVLDRFGVASNVELPEVWTEKVSLPGSVRVGPTIAGSKYAPVGSAVSLLRAFLNISGAASWKNSNLFLAGTEGAALPYFTPALRHDLDVLVEMTNVGYGETLGTSENPEEQELWMRVLAEQQAVAKLFAKHNDGKAPQGRLDPTKLLELITLPQMLLMGCTELRRLALCARSRWADAGRPLTGNTWFSYRDANWDWAIATIILCDGLRVKNYSGALLNRHIIPNWERGRAVALRTRFWGMRDEARVTLKKDWGDDTRSKENERENDIYPAVLDADLLTDFLLVIRAERLVRAGLVKSVEGFDRETDRYALFPSTEDCPEKQDRVRDVDGQTGAAFSPQQIPGTRTGRYAKPERVSEQVGRIVHWMVRDVMKRAGVPEWGSREIVKLFRGLFGGHRTTRAGNASCWGFECDDWTYAQWITNDTLKTLKRYYSRALNPSGLERLDKRTGLDKVGHFAGVMKHIRDGGLIDWDLFDPERPEKATRPADWRPGQQAKQKAA
jgi:hypothetical protein